MSTALSRKAQKTKLSRSRVEVPQLALDVLAKWRLETPYPADDDFVFPSFKLGGRKPRTASTMVQDYLRPAAIGARILVERDGKLYSKDGDPVERFGFHNLGRHSLASFLMDERENPTVVQAILRHSKIDMRLLLRALVKKNRNGLRSTTTPSTLCQLLWKICGYKSGYSQLCSDRGQSLELWCYHELTAI